MIDMLPHSRLLTSSFSVLQDVLHVFLDCTADFLFHVAALMVLL